MEPSQILGTRWNLLVFKTAPFLRGTRGGVVLLSSRVWKGVNGWALEIGISCTYSNPVVTGGQKHTLTYVLRIKTMTSLILDHVAMDYL
jgi:hypothetical protein